MKRRSGWRPLLVIVVIAMFIAPVAVLAAHEFTDVPDTNAFHDDIMWLADAGVTLGCNPPANDEFCPDDSVKRQQMAAFLRRFAVYLGAEDGIVSEADHAATADSAGDAATLGGTARADFYTKAEVDAAIPTDFYTQAEVDAAIPTDFYTQAEVDAAIAAAAVQGAYTIEELNTVPSGTTMFMGVSCSAGDLMVGGGWQTLSPDLFLIEHNRPTTMGETWEVAGFNSSMAPLDVTISVRCLDMTP